MRTRFLRQFSGTLLLGGLSACASPGSPPPRFDRPPRAFSEEEEPKKNTVGLFLGSTVREGGGEGTVGVKYERRTSKEFGFGGIFEWVPDDREEVLLAPAVFFHPWRQLSVTLSPGVEFEGDERFFLVRVGLGWDFELGGGFSLAPELNYDMVDGLDNALVVGLTIGYAF